MREVLLSELRLLAEAGALREATLHGHYGKFQVKFRIGAEDMRLVAKAGNPRAFRDLTRAAQLLHELGIRKAHLDLEQYAGSQDEPRDMTEEPEKRLAVPEPDKNTDSDLEAEPTN